MIRDLNDDQISSVRYKKLFDSITDGILILSYPDGKIMDINDSFCQILGYERKSLINSNFWEIDLFKNHNLALDTYAELLKGNSVKLLDASILSSTGNEVVFDFSGEVYKIDHKSIIQLNFYWKKQIQALQKEINDIKNSLQKATDEVIQALLSMTRFKDPYTANHQIGVSKLGTAIAQEMGLSNLQIDGIRVSGLIHDIGKISLPAEILTKAGALNSYEIALIQNHVKVGFDILKGLEFPWQIAKIVLQHHERNDGLGYPNHLTENNICIEAKVLAVADTIEAMAHFRPYRPALGIEAALHQIEIDKGTKFDTEIVEACRNLFQLKKFSFDSA
jgi:putative nucleotidyltransferase with HDIG domain/PAS domain S-box-containing protein